MSNENRIRKSYVVSEDIHILLAEWAVERGFVTPSNRFFKQLRGNAEKHLSRVFGANNVDMVPAYELRDGITALVQQVGLPAVSMDRVYVRTNPEIQVSRGIDGSLGDCGIVPRFGACSISDQLLAIKERFAEVALIDDVIFSGKVVTEVLLSLEAIGVKVPVVVAGITIGEGAQRLSEETDANIFTVRYYKEVIDEICERDFYLGVPLSGRFVVGMSTERGAPYLQPFGKPCDWASIPEDRVPDFSAFCIRQTIRLWEEIERLSGKMVQCRGLERIPIGLPHDRSRFVDYLKFL